MLRRRFEPPDDLQEPDFDQAVAAE
jgi:hypothetical protein